MQSALKKPCSDNTVVACKTDGNPEGKGLNGLMLDWYQSEPRGVATKPHRQILAELFTSMLVLSATFWFRPAISRETFLYWINGEWSLSLIAPDEWSDERRAGFVGTCVLQRDMTWTITPSGLLTEDNPASDAVGRFYDAFARMLDTDLAVEEILPFHVSRLPYYQRLYANALSRSTRAAMMFGEPASSSCRQWSRLLPQRNNVLLVFKG